MAPDEGRAWVPHRSEIKRLGLYLSGTGWSDSQKKIRIFSLLSWLLFSQNDWRIGMAPDEGRAWVPHRSEIKRLGLYRSGTGWSDSQRVIGIFSLLSWLLFSQKDCRIGMDEGRA